MIEKAQLRTKVYTWGQRVLAAGLLLVPVVLFVILRFNPELDARWELQVFHFYVVSYTSLVALVVASFVLAGIGAGGARALFVAIAFVAMAGFFFIHGATTPGVIIPGPNQAVGWAARLSLMSGAIFMGAAMVNLAPETQRRLIERRYGLWAGLIVVYGVFLWVAFVWPGFLEQLAQHEVAVHALATVALFLWGGWRAWAFYWREPDRLTLALGFALPWLALAQVSQHLAPLWASSWWMYHVLMLAAFVVTMAALVMDYEGVRGFRLPRYFTSLSLIVGVPLVGLLSEVAVRLSGVEAVRWPMFGFSLAMLLILFSALLAVVYRAQSILDERADALRQEQQWRTDLTNLVVHDLKSPLNSVFINLDLVLRGRMGPVTDEQRLRLERVQNSAKAMTALLDTLLDAERLEAGVLRPTLAPCDPAALVEESVNAIAEQAEVAGIQVTTATLTPLPTLQADGALLLRVLQNLLTNAIKFTPKGGHIRVEAVADAHRVTISVSDNGPGVHPADRQRIFEKFGQAPGMARRGTGLGLTFCKLAVEAHGGRIWVEDAPGGGSRFAFSLPLSPKPPNAAA